MKIRKLLIASCILTTGLLLPASGAQKDDGWLEPVGSEYETVSVKKTNYSEKKYVTGLVTPAIYELTSQVSGEAACYVSVGDTVDKYQHLVCINKDADYLEAELSAQKVDTYTSLKITEQSLYDAETQELTQELDRLKVKINAGTASAEEKMRAELADLELRKRENGLGASLSDIEKLIYSENSKYENMLKGVTKNIIYSPAAGTVLYCTVINGNNITAWMKTIAIMDSEKVYIGSSNTGIEDAAAAAKYDEINAYFDGIAYPVEYVAKPGKGFDSGKAYFTVPVETDKYTDVILELVTEKQEDVLVLPLCTIYTNGAQKYVYRVKDGIKEMVDVVLGDDNGSVVVITGGDLREGDEIYVP